MRDLSRVAALAAMTVPMKIGHIARAQNDGDFSSTVACIGQQTRAERYEEGERHGPLIPIL